MTQRFIALLCLQEQYVWLAMCNKLPPAYVLRDNHHPPTPFSDQQWSENSYEGYMTPVLRKLFLTARPALSSLRFSAAPYISRRTMVRFISKKEQNLFLPILSF
jgi:hypothetical protein